MAGMTELESVNYLLSLLGSSPVGDLATLHPDAEACKQRLDEANGTVQGEGWWFNEEYLYELTPDAVTKEIAVPVGTMEAQCTSHFNTVLRGSKLYDSANHTYQFNESRYVNLIIQLDWTLLPNVVTDAIRFHAGVLLCSIDLEDSKKASEQSEFANMAYMKMKKTDLRSRRRNIFLNQRVQRAQSGVRPYNFGNGGIDPTRPGG